MMQPMLSTIIRAVAAILIGYALFRFSAYHIGWVFSGAQPNAQEARIIAHNANLLLISCIHQAFWGLLLFAFARPLSRLLTDARSTNVA